MASSDHGGQLRRFPSALGGMLIHPGQSLAEIEARQRGGVSLVLTWAILAAITMRLPALADAVAGFQAGGALRILSVLTSDLARAIPPVLVAALIIVVLAGGKRDPAADFELGAASALPFLVVRAALATAASVSAWDVSERQVWLADAVGAAWSLVPLALSLRLARRRPAGRGSDPTAAQRLRAAIAGWTALGILVVALGGGLRFVLRNVSHLGPIAVGQPAPDFTLPRVDGQPGAVSLSSLRGQVVLIDFWATWCPPCIAMMPWLHDLHHDLAPQGVALLGVNQDGDQSSRDDVAMFLRTNPAPYPVVYDDGRVGGQYRVRALPTLVIVGRDGNVDRVLVGMVPKSVLTRALTAALARRN